MSGCSGGTIWCARSRNSRFAIYSHIIRREIEPKIPSTFDNDLCREIDERYDASLSKRRMFVNDIYLTIIRRPLQGHAGTFEAHDAEASGQKEQGGQARPMKTKPKWSCGT